MKKIGSWDRKIGSREPKKGSWDRLGVEFPESTVLRLDNKFIRGVNCYLQPQLKILSDGTLIKQGVIKDTIDSLSTLPITSIVNVTHPRSHNDNHLKDIILQRTQTKVLYFPLAWKETQSVVYTTGELENDILVEVVSWLTVKYRSERYFVRSIFCGYRVQKGPKFVINWSSNHLKFVFDVDIQGRTK